ncbi:hypothetical protein CIG75_16225 [Tumebacillus algifaecis]|uniref:SLH domain-containing protein n=1 Tax=Tumebacillus algifaecis TaxID=1214604 RepID=A0A223D406_9BACL|nr:S-layer homology domain-containing protein [Tumebacillus algifaecis]ASS76342.1 hypothetical protein CIG75_16225 [Tumebacillus algifaecis]
MNWKRLALTGCLTAGLLLGPIPVAPAVYADTTIAIKTYGSGVTAEGVYQDRGVSLRGTPVFLTVESLDGDTVHLDQTKTDENGIYRFDWTMAQDFPSGLYRATVSVQGEQKSSTFNFVSKKGDGMVSPIDTGPYRFTGELNSGQKQTVLYDSGTGVQVERRSGMSFVTLNESRALSAVRGATTGTTYLTISVPTTDRYAQVTIPAAVIKEVINRFGRSAHLLIAAEAGSYDLPLPAVNETLLNSVLNSNGGSLQFTIASAEQTDRTAIQTKLQVQKINNPMLMPVQFGVQALFGGQSVPLLDYGNRFVQVSIDLTGAVLSSDQTASALFYHPRDEHLVPSPSKLFRDTVGHGKLVIKRSGNGIYVPIQDAKSFTDIQYTPQRSKIQELSNRHIINGRTTTSFAPQGNITRAEFATLMMLSLGLSDKQGTSLFRDVPKNTWFTKPVGIGSTLGLISGHDAWTFAPHSPITREEIASLMVRCLSFVEQRPYVDTTRILGQVQDRNNVSSWAREDVALAISTGILDKNISSVEPRRAATRAESADMLYNLLTYLKMI